MLVDHNYSYIPTNCTTKHRKRRAILNSSLVLFPGSPSLLNKPLSIFAYHILFWCFCPLYYMFKIITNVKILTNKIKDVKVLHCPYTLVFPISVNKTWRSKSKLSLELDNLWWFYFRFLRTSVLLLTSQLFCESRNKHILIRLGKYTDLINLTAVSVSNTKEHSLLCRCLYNICNCKVVWEREVLFGCLGAYSASLCSQKLWT